jgi:hypothetical protein
MYPHDLPAFVAMFLGTRYAAGALERLSIYAGRTCGIAAEISWPLLDREVRWVPIGCEEDGRSAVLVGMLREIEHGR